MNWTKPTGLSTDCRETLLSVVHKCGWVCHADCRIKHKDQINKLQTSLSRVHEEVANLRAQMMQLKHDADAL